ncbi:TetR family transcriptional regulator [Rhodococcus hoagii]|nr:TetR family transcriptional regulator [Prescottella equi]
MTAEKSAPANPVATAAVDRLVGKRRAGYADDAARLIGACRELIAESGAFDPPVGQILERAGLSSRAFYRLFSTKEELLVAVLQDGTNTMVAHIEEQMAAADGPLAQIEAWVRAALTPYGEAATSHTGSLLSHSRGWEKAFPEEMSTIRTEFLEPLVRAIRQSSPTADDTLTERAAEFIYYAYVGMASKSDALGRALTGADIDALCQCATLIATEFAAPTASHQPRDKNPKEVASY